MLSALSIMPVDCIVANKQTKLWTFGRKEKGEDPTSNIEEQKNKNSAVSAISLPKSFPPRLRVLVVWSVSALGIKSSGVLTELTTCSFEGLSASSFEVSFAPSFPPKKS